MISALNIRIAKDGQFTVRYVSGDTPEERSAIAVELREKIQPDITRIADCGFVGRIQVIGKQLETMQADIQQVMKNWVDYFEDCPSYNKRRFNAARGIERRRNIFTRFQSEHLALPDKRESSRVAQIVSRVAQTVSSFSTGDNGFLVSHIGRGPVGEELERIREIRLLYLQKLFPLWKTRRLSIKVKGTLEDIRKGLVEKTKTLVKCFDARDEEQRQVLVQRDQRASQAYPSLEVELVSLTPVAEDALLSPLAEDEFLSPSTEPLSTTPDLDDEDEFLRTEELEAALEVSIVPTTVLDVLGGWRFANAGLPVEEPAPPILDFFA